MTAPPESSDSTGQSPAGNDVHKTRSHDGLHRMVRVIRRFRPLLPPAVFAVALWILHREFAHLHFKEILPQLRTLSPAHIMTAVGLTLLSYLVLTGYDALSLRYVGNRLAWWRSALTSFMSFAFSNNVGLAVFSSAPIRFRLYSAWGLSVTDIGAVVAFNGMTFVIGMATVAGLALTAGAGSLPEGIGLSTATVRCIGIAGLVIVIGYVAACTVFRGPIRLFRRSFSPPPPATAIAQIAVSSLDWLVASSVLWVLLPTGSSVGFWHFLTVFMAAQGLGLISQVPGGVGVFETVVVLLLPTASTTAVLGSLLAYRLVYYLMPLSIATVLFLGYELSIRKAMFGRIIQAVRAGIDLAAPRFLAAVTLIAGAVLLGTGAIPELGSRIHLLAPIIPLPILEVSHFLGSLVGLTLLLLSSGLRHRLASAYWLTLVCLSAGAALSLLRGFDWHEAVVLTVALAVLAPARRAFYRTGRLLSEPLSPSWITAIAMVLMGSAWLGLFAYRHVDYSNELFWQFTLDGDAPRFLRAGIAVAAGLVVFGTLRFLRPSPPGPHQPTTEEMERIRAVVRASPRASAHLALVGDKRFLLADSGSSFLMYGISGRSWISMGDPVGRETDFADLVWQFHHLADRHGAWSVFYEVRDSTLPMYLDLGLAPFKIGEEALIPLEDFSLAGSGGRHFRNLLNRLDREGCTFEVVPAASVSPILPELAAVSSGWLARKNAREKGFSLGRFDENYLRHNPVAVVRLAGSIVAFANLWPGCPGGELSIDLMRSLPEAPRGTMDYLFLKLFDWGKAEGFAAFSLGMAPLSGLQNRPNAPAWHQLGSLVSRWGEPLYNFQGLRRYKEKFGPVWSPRYLVCPHGRVLPRALADVVSLISGGLLGTLHK